MKDNRVARKDALDLCFKESGGHSGCEYVLCDADAADRLATVFTREAQGRVLR